VTTQRAQARPRVAMIVGMVVGLLIVVGVVALAIK
jgi:predicted nucleic acid-binding Zn ribbon protein